MPMLLDINMIKKRMGFFYYSEFILESFQTYNERKTVIIYFFSDTFRNKSTRRIQKSSFRYLRNIWRS